MALNRVTKESIQLKIQRTEFLRIPDSTVTVCVIFLENGFKSVGHSACVDASNFDENIGRDIAYENAFNKIWEIEGYLLAENLYREKLG